MEYGKIAGVGKPVSRIVFGCMQRRMSAGLDSSELLEGVLRAGVNAFDTARVYGASESALGRWLAGKDREKLVVITKGCHPSFINGHRLTRDCLAKDLKKSLSLLKTEYVDLYFLHRDDESVPVGDIVQMLNEFAENGKIRAFGASNWKQSRIAAANEYAETHGLRPFSASSPYFGLAEQVREPWKGCVGLTGRENAAARAWYCGCGLPVFAYSSLAGGLLSGKFKAGERTKGMSGAAKRGYLSEKNTERLARAEKLAREKGATVAQIALAWLFKQGLNTFAILSASSAKRIASNAECFSVSLTEEEAAWLNLAR